MAVHHQRVPSCLPTTEHLLTEKDALPEVGHGKEVRASGRDRLLNEVAPMIPERGGGGTVSAE